MDKPSRRVPLFLVKKSSKKCVTTCLKTPRGGAQNMKIMSICPLYKKIIYISDTYIEKPSGQTGGQTVGQTRKSHFFVQFLVPFGVFRWTNSWTNPPKMPFFQCPIFMFCLKSDTYGVFLPFFARLRRTLSSHPIARRAHIVQRPIIFAPAKIQTQNPRSGLSAPGIIIS